MSDSSAIVSKAWNYPPSFSELRRPGAQVLKNAGVGYGDYVEQITYLQFDSDLRSPNFAPPSLKLRRAGNPIPQKFTWSELSRKVAAAYRRSLYASSQRRDASATFSLPCLIYKTPTKELVDASITTECFFKQTL